MSITGLLTAPLKAVGADRADLLAVLAWMADPRRQHRMRHQGTLRLTNGLAAQMVVATLR